MSTIPTLPTEVMQPTYVGFFNGKGQLLAKCYRIGKMGKYKGEVFRTGTATRMKCYAHGRIFQIVSVGTNLDSEVTLNTRHFVAGAYIEMDLKLRLVNKA